MNRAEAEAIVEAFCVANDSDLIVYWGDLRADYEYVLRNLAKRRRRRNCVLWLTTRGGDPNTAYRIARTLQRFYKTRVENAQEKGTWTIFVSNICKSAGTIVATGADKLYMTDDAELGPIDVQLRKPDEVGERTSGLTPIQALGGLETHSLNLFRKYFRVLRFDEELSFSTKMAAEIATNVTTGLFTSLYEQIDPIRLAEVERSLKISGEYVTRISKSGNLKAGGLEQLLGNYPSHGFIIDRLEAAEIFTNVEEPPEQLQQIEEYYGRFARDVANEGSPVLFFTLSNEPPAVAPAGEAGAAAVEGGGAG